MEQKIKSVPALHGMIEKYINKISGPMLDRIDIHIEVPQVKYEKLDSSIATQKSEEIKKLVNAARAIQNERYKEHGIFSNSELTTNLIEKYCKLNSESKKIMKKAFDRLGLSVRAYNKILKVSRTIADLDSSEEIQTNHVAEAIQYRTLDRKYWK